MEKKTYAVEGMACAHCKSNVENALKALDGVKIAVANLENKNVEIEFDPSVVSPKQMCDAVDDAGYQMNI